MAAKRKPVYTFFIPLTVIITFMTAGNFPVYSQPGTKPDKTPAEAKKISNAADKNSGSAKEALNTKPDTSKKETGSGEAASDVKKAEKIETTLEYGIQKDRKTAIIMIKEIKDVQIRNRILQKLALIVENDSDIDMRKASVTALGDYKASQHTDIIIKALDDPSDDVKMAACFALGRIKADQAKPKLVELFKKQDLTRDSNLTDSVISTLGELNSPDILDTAVVALKDMKTSKMVRERLILYIGQTGSAAQKDILVELFKNDDEDLMIRSYAVKSIARLKLKETIPAIKEFLKEIDSYPFNKRKQYYDLYMHAVAALAEMGDSDAIPLLMNSLRSDNAGVRYKAVNLIKEFNDERTIDILKYKMKNDPSKKVRKAARKALEEKGLVEKGKDSEDIKEEYDKEDKDE